VAKGSRRESAPKPFPDDYWNRSAIRDRGDENEEQVFRAVGRALTSWEKLEEGFAWLFTTILQSPGSSAAARRVYGSITTSHGRREALRAAAEITLGSQHQTAFNQLIKNFADASARRDDIAHGVVMRLSTGSITTQTDPDNLLASANFVGCYLSPSPYVTQRTYAFGPPPNAPIFASGKYLYTSADIDAFADKFDALRAHLNSVGVEILESLKST
jgi:hypothetical protein